MKKQIIIPIILTLMQFSVKSYAHENKDTLDIKDSQSKEWERPLNFFAAAGASYMFGNHYSVTVSPVDNTVQFEQTFSILTRFSLGLVWNPIPAKESLQDFLDKRNRDKYYKIAREHLAVALLINVFQLSYANDFNSSSPIDVGFGIGYRDSNFLILGTIELTPLRTPRAYFVDQYKDKNLPLILSGSSEPVRTISVDDNALFTNKIFPSIGLKIAYSFTTQK
jgi:hypothetical protein